MLPVGLRASEHRQTPATNRKPRKVAANRGFSVRCGAIVGPRGVVLLPACIGFVGVEGGGGADREVGRLAERDFLRAQDDVVADTGEAGAVGQLDAGGTEGRAPGGAGCGMHDGLYKH